MTHQFSQIMFTDGVKTVQSEFGSREKQARFNEMASPNDRLGEAEAASNESFM